MFFALKGENFNGNLFAEQALEKGARFAIIEEGDSENEDVFKVSNVLETLQQLANYHRQHFTCPVIGITGTNGKTTTKELLNEVLSSHYKTYATVGNFNNHLGVPLTLLSIPIDAEMVIIEMGANKPGDIEELMRIAEPNYGFITNVGKAHLEGFGSFEGVKKTKGELYDEIKQTGGKVFLNTLNPELVFMANQRGFDDDDVISYLGVDSKIKTSLVDQTPLLKFKIEERSIITTNLVGEYNYENIVAAIVVGDELKVPLEKIEKAISEYMPSNNRSQVKEVGSNVVLMDAYNANPTSMEAALSNLSSVSFENKAAILGDMFELGVDSVQEHRSVVDRVKELELDLAIFCGENFHKEREIFKEALFFKTTLEAQNYLGVNKIKNALILLKGSRGMKLESLVEYLAE